MYSESTSFEKFDLMLQVCWCFFYRLAGSWSNGGEGSSLCSWSSVATVEDVLHYDVSCPFPPQVWQAYISLARSMNESLWRWCGDAERVVSGWRWHSSTVEGKRGRGRPQKKWTDAVRKLVKTRDISDKNGREIIWDQVYWNRFVCEGKIANADYSIT